MGDLLPWGGIFQPWSRTGLVYDRIGAEFSEAHSLGACLRFEAPVLGCYMLPLWGSSGAGPPLLFHLLFLIFSHLTLSHTNFQESLLHHLFQLISYPWSAQKFQLFFTFPASAVWLLWQPLSLLVFLIVPSFCNSICPAQKIYSWSYSGS